MISRPAGGHTVPFGVVEECRAGTILTQPQSNWTVPPRFGSWTFSTPASDSSSAETVAFGLPLMNGSTRTLVLPSVSSTADWPRKRISMWSVLSLHEFVSQLVPDRDPHQHRDAGLLRDQRADGGHPLFLVLPG